MVCFPPFIRKVYEERTALSFCLPCPIHGLFRLLVLIYRKRLGLEIAKSKFFDKKNDKMFGNSEKCFTFAPENEKKRKLKYNH